ncbi:hypothetical protein BGZ95_009087 [Linnemannia exigua]|uniref:Uncharacterized protein n=1 Tax=Linnemannia exigua TaxID=604196 RepID=A0AAD4DKS0_9FUNG|nr:hypothetical protein BGZ95_009087 [Linnemannia exigua]
MATKPQNPTALPDPTTPPQPSKPSSSEGPPPPPPTPTTDIPKTTTDTKPSEATTTPATTEPKPTTMSTVDPPVTNPSQDPPVVTTTGEPSVTTTTVPPVITTATSDPPVTTATTDPPVTTIITSNPPVTATTTNPPVTTTAITKDPPDTATTTKDPPVTRTTKPTSKDPPRTTTVPPYTTRYVTTISIVTVTTVVPQPTVISGRGTTIYITRSTTSPVPTIIQDPTQEPPPTTQIDPLTKGDGLHTWQITLIIVATLVVMGAVGAVVLVGRIKRQRRRDSVLFNGDGLESVLGSEMGESGKSNMNLFGGGGGGGGGSGGHQQLQQQQYYLAAQGGNGGERGLYDSGDPSSGGGGGVAAPGVVSRGWGWRKRFSAWRPWDSHGSYHSQQQHPGHDYQGQGQAAGGGLWLMDDPDPHYDRSASAAVATAAAMRPVSYDTNGTGPGETIVGGDEDPYYHGGNNTQSRDRYYDQHPGDATAAYALAARERERGIAGTLHPLDENHTLAQRSPSSVTTAATAMRSRSQHQQHLQQQQQQQQRPGSRGGSATGHSSPSIGHLERLSGEGLDFVDPHGALHRQSQDWTLSSATSGGVGVGTSGGATGDRTSIRVDPDQLESHAKFELFRKAPQAILGTDTPSSPPQGQSPPEGTSPPLPSAPPPPPSPTATTAAEAESETGNIKSGDKGNENAVPLQSEVVSDLGDQTAATSITLLPVVDDTPLSNPIPVNSEQQQQ